MLPRVGGYGRKLCLSLLSLLSLAGCGPSVSSGGSDGTGGQGIAVAHACAFETRQEDHCGGDSPASSWFPACDDGPCPTWLDDNNITSFDAEGNTCETDSEYRNVVDVPTTCAEWRSAGEPLVHPTSIYCGASLLHNEFDNNTGIENIGACQACIQRSCPNQYVSCYPSDGTGYKPSRCDDLIRCMRNCVAGGDATATACTQQYSDVVSSANDFYGCAIASCASNCN
jgi:hypothetical protein